MSRVAPLLALLVLTVEGKVFERCELAKELLKLGVEKSEVSTWVCIAEKESNFNTSAVGKLNGDGSGDHGIFQISDRYWCSPQGWACNIPCSLLEDDDITDDWKCARRIFKQHKILSGNGFSAWAVYGPHCSGDTSSFAEKCFDNEVKPEPEEAETTPTILKESPPQEEVITDVSNHRERNNAEKVQVLDPRDKIGEKTSKSLVKPHTTAGRLWRPWTWDI